MSDSIAILAGGMATRLGDLVKDTPKSMLTVADHPFVHHQLLWLHTEGIRNVVMCVGHHGEKIQGFVGDGSKYGMRVSFSYDGQSLVGTGGAVKKALPLLANEFFTIYGDTYLNVSFNKIRYDFCQFEAPDGIMTIYKNNKDLCSSNVKYVDFRIKKYSKTQDTDMHHMDYGLSLFRKKTFDKIDLETFDLSVAHNNLISEGELGAFEVDERFYEIGTENGLIETDAYLRSKNV